jgi:hypothetical protein
MNKMIFASIAAVATALMGTPIRAEAGHHHHDDDDEVIAAIGGFVGGLIVGAAINTNVPPPPPAPVAVAVSYGHGHGNHRHGHWEWTTVRVWVPGRWAYVDRECSRPRRVWVDGYYTHRRERVWVSHGHNRHCERGCR